MPRFPFRAPRAPRAPAARSSRAALTVRSALAALSVALAPLALAAWQGCGIYGDDLLLPSPPGGDDASADASPDAAPPDTGVPDADTCAHTRWPGPPAADDPSTGPPVDAITALASLSMGTRDGGAPPSGFDLDGVCTCPAPDSCANASTTKPHCDGAGGGDNSGGALLATLGAFGVFDQAQIDDRLAQGLFGLIIQVRDWNGQPNDTKVTVAVFVSNGVSGVEDGGAPRPKHDGTDRWTVDPSALLGGASLDGTDCDGGNTRCIPAFFDSAAYVAGGTLVGSLDFPVSLGSVATVGNIVLDLSGSVVSARLTKGASGYSLEGGLLAGRWATGKLLTGLAALSDPLASGQFLCGGDPTYQSLKTQICAAADVTTDPKLDRTGAACSALSVAFGFTAVPAHLGEVFDKGTIPAGCSGDAGAAYHDDCK